LEGVNTDNSARDVLALILSHAFAGIRALL
jgi:hypothetical protein